MVDGSHKKKQKHMKTTNGDDLPFSLISSEILSRIPAKSDIGRCRCVCKQWNSFLSTPTFTRMHLRRHVSINDYKLLLFDPQSLVPFCRLPFTQTLPNPNPNPNPSVLCIVASLDGLVCLGSREPPATLMFWNPFTGAYKKLSSIPCMFTPKFFFTRDPIGFYVDSSNDYKLVCLINSGWAHVYSNRLDSWKKIEFSIFSSNHKWIWSQGTFCAQCVYFTVTSYFDPSLNRVPDSLIICFDVERETFRKIRFPSVPDGAVIDYHRGGLVVLDGCLHLSLSYTMFNRGLKHGDLWRMDDGDEWVKVAAFSDPGAQHQQHRRICTVSTGNWVAVLDEDENSFKKMNTEDFTTRYRYFGSASREHRSSRIAYAETLVSP